MELDAPMQGHSDADHIMCMSIVFDPTVVLSSFPLGVISGQLPFVIAQRVPSVTHDCMNACSFRNMTVRASP